MNRYLTILPGWILCAITVCLATGGAAWGAETTKAGAKGNNVIQYLPYIIGGALAIAILGIGFLFQLSKKSPPPEALPHELDSVELPACAPSAGNPLARLAVPLLIVAGLGIGGYCLYSAFGDGVDIMPKQVSVPPPAITLPVTDPIPSPQPFQFQSPQISQPQIQIQPVKIQPVTLPQPPRIR